MSLIYDKNVGEPLFAKRTYPHIEGYNILMGKADCPSTCYSPQHVTKSAFTFPEGNLSSFVNRLQAASVGSEAERSGST